ncbi:MAG: YitT family protein, partial [Bacilli bacterium]|nr:YitT family protein [Bacilli bacterium]
MRLVSDKEIAIIISLMENGKKTFAERYRSWGYQHLVLKRILEYGWLLLVSTAAAFVFSFSFRVFLQPNVYSLGEAANGLSEAQIIISGGVSGVSQNIELLLHLICRQFGDDGMAFFNAVKSNLYSILYFVLNIPLFIIAWRGIGKRFAVFTIINVLEVSILTRVFAAWDFPYRLYEFIFEHGGGFFGRAFFAGVLTGLASAMAFKFDFSNGGIDIVAYYFALRKNTSVGKYATGINVITIVFYTLLSGAIHDWESAQVTSIIGGVMFSVVYLFVAAFVIDFINVRNKKVEIKIVTSMPELSKILLLNIPHGQTLVDAVGAFSGAKRTIITMVISSFEVNSVVKLVQLEDPNAFVQVVPLT